MKIFLAAFILVFAINIGIITATQNNLKEKTGAALEAARPANISLIIIKDSSCADCADISPIVGAVKKTNVKITKEETFSAGICSNRGSFRISGFDRNLASDRHTGKRWSFCA